VSANRICISRNQTRGSTAARNYRRSRSTRPARFRSPTVFVLAAISVQFQSLLSLRLTALIGAISISRTVFSPLLAPADLPLRRGMWITLPYLSAARELREAPGVPVVHGREVQIGEIIAITTKLYVPIGGRRAFKWPCALSRCRMQMRQIADKHGSPPARRHNIAVIIEPASPSALPYSSSPLPPPSPCSGRGSAISPCANTCERDVDVSLCVIHRAARYRGVTPIHEHRRRARAHARAAPV